MIDQLTQIIEARPEPTEEQWDAWRSIVSTHAPDLMEMLGLDGAA